MLNETDTWPHVYQMGPPSWGASWEASDMTGGITGGVPIT